MAEKRDLSFNKNYQVVGELNKPSLHVSVQTILLSQHLVFPSCGQCDGRWIGKLAST